jgi:hypothetical protein
MTDQHTPDHALRQVATAPPAATARVDAVHAADDTGPNPPGRFQQAPQQITNERGITDPPTPPATLADLAVRFGRWHATEDEAEITIPPYWTRGADHDDPNGGPNTAYVTGASPNPDDEDAYDLGQRGAVAEWTRVVARIPNANGGELGVEIVGADSVEVIGNDVRTVRDPARIRVGSSAWLHPVGALQLADALRDAAELVTDDENAYAMYLDALAAAAGHAGTRHHADAVGELAPHPDDVPWRVTLHRHGLIPLERKVTLLAVNLEQATSRALLLRNPGETVGDVRAVDPDRPHSDPDPEPNAGVLGDPRTDTREPLLECGCPAQVVRDEGHQPGCTTLDQPAGYPDVTPDGVSTVNPGRAGG